MSSSSTPHALIPLVERALSAVWNIDVRLKVEWIASNQLASHVFRVRTHATGHDLPPTLIVKAAKPEFDLGSQKMVFNEWAALIHLQQIGCDPAVAARFHAGHLDDRGPFIVDGGSRDRRRKSGRRLETIRPTAIAKRVALTADIPSTRYIVTGDPARLQQVIWNLLSNAVKFTPAGGSVSLVVRAAESDLVAIDVADTGIGMPPAFLPHVFERFWQADSSTTRVHGGLGLAIVRHIVELHGGEVHASSEGEGRGSTFNVVLPAWVRQPAVPDVPSDPAEAEEATVDVSGVEMLVVDDDLAAREVCTAILESAGARVLTAASAAEAFVIVERETLKLMILDIGMPGENGLALLRRIRERELLHGVRSTPAIAMTAYSGATEREQAAAAGFAVHLTKPVLPRDLLSAVQRALSSEPLA